MIKGGVWGDIDMEGGKLQGRYPEEDTGQYTVYSAQNYPQRGPRPCDFGITNEKIVSRYSI